MENGRRVSKPISHLRNVRQPLFQVYGTVLSPIGQRFGTYNDAMQQKSVYSGNCECQAICVNLLGYAQVHHTNCKQNGLIDQANFVVKKSCL